MFVVQGAYHIAASKHKYIFNVEHFDECREQNQINHVIGRRFRRHKVIVQAPRAKCMLQSNFAAYCEWL